MLQHSIRAALHLPFLIKRIRGYIGIQKQFINNYVEPVLKQAMLKNDGSLDEDDLKKITGYYGLAVPAILGESFCALRGFPMTEKERGASTCQGAITGLFDDFFDKDFLEEEIIKDRINEQAATSVKKSNEKLFEIFYNEALQNVPRREQMKNKLIDVYHAQVDSLEQKEFINKERLLAITLYKGGASLQFYRSAFEHPLAPGEDELMYKAGGIMQLANDVFDVYKDREAQIKTLVTTATKIKDVRVLFSKLLSAFYIESTSLPYPHRNIRIFLDILSIGIFNRCYVCLDQLEKNEMHTGNTFQVDKYSRKQLICDMDTKKNMLRSAAYFLRSTN